MAASCGTYLKRIELVCLGPSQQSSVVGPWDFKTLSHPRKRRNRRQRQKREGQGVVVRVRVAA